MKTFLLSITFISAFVFLFDIRAQAMDGCGGWQRPHGNYCEGPGWGWYGERKSVRTPEEAKKVVLRYFSSSGTVKVSNLKEREWFFEADVRDRKGALIDRVIVDKRTGRIRSVY